MVSGKSFKPKEVHCVSIFEAYLDFTTLTNKWIWLCSRMLLPSIVVLRGACDVHVMCM